jgi:hypothetical protein
MVIIIPFLAQISLYKFVSEIIVKLLTFRLFYAILEYHPERTFFARMTKVNEREFVDNFISPTTQEAVMANNAKKSSPESSNQGGQGGFKDTVRGAARELLYDTIVFPFQQMLWGGRKSSGGGQEPQPVAKGKEDDAIFIDICNIFESAGTRGLKISSNLQLLVEAARQAHPEYAESARRLPIADYKEGGEARKELDRLLEAIPDDYDGDSIWQYLLKKGKVGIIGRSRKYGEMVEKEINNTTSPQQAAAIVVDRLIQDETLQGGVGAKAAKARNKASAWIAEAANAIQEEWPEPEKKVSSTMETQTSLGNLSKLGKIREWSKPIMPYVTWLKPTTPFRAIRLAMILLVALMFLGSITAPIKDDEVIQKENPVNRWEECLEKKREEAKSWLGNAFTPSFKREQKKKEGAEIQVAPKTNNPDNSLKKENNDVCS